MFWYNTKIIQNSSNPADPVMMICEPHHDAKFVCNILEKFRDAEASQLCVADKVIQQVGYRHYCLRRCHESKQDERKSVRQEMRELARLLLQFRSTAWMGPTWGEKPCLPDNTSLCCGSPSTPWQKGASMAYCHNHEEPEAT